MVQIWQGGKNRLQKSWFKHEAGVEQDNGARTAQNKTVIFSKEFQRQIRHLTVSNCAKVKPPLRGQYKPDANRAGRRTGCCSAPRAFTVLSRASHLRFIPVLLHFLGPAAVEALEQAVAPGLESVLGPLTHVPAGWPSRGALGHCWPTTARAATVTGIDGRGVVVVGRGGGEAARGEPAVQGGDGTSRAAPCRSARARTHANVQSRAHTLARASTRGGENLHGNLKIRTPNTGNRRP